MPLKQNPLTTKDFKVPNDGLYICESNTDMTSM